ncbi:YiaA/YiaB family inner membrane protein, partial [Escherichia coli]|uniref:YiaA/YiaB family inner membrane protein n=1 Tax=Escherichia coli TaxID=562 RepID=UPI000C9A7854
MKTSKTVAKLLFVVGALVYLVGLWISCPLLSGKGYFLGVLMTATFGNYWICPYISRHLLSLNPLQA